MEQIQGEFNVEVGGLPSAHADKIEILETIAAISTPQAPGGLGVVRISGMRAFEIADKVFYGISGKALTEYEGYRAGFGGVYEAGEFSVEEGVLPSAHADRKKIDEAVALVFRAPKSYTGENTVEISCHGGLYVMRRVLDAVLAAGARIAAPGEFTKRAFLNGKMDLTQAESVMQLIHAGGEQAAKEAVAAADGALSRKIEGLKVDLKHLGAHLAAWADFPEEDVPQVEESQLKNDLKKNQKVLSELVKSFYGGQAFREGINAVIVGKTNVGKSTLMNMLSGRERSIVTHIPGTTRDVIEDTVFLAGIPVRLADTAGIRETADLVEQMGVSLSWKRLENAQLVLAVFDMSIPLDEDDKKLLEHLNPANTVAVVNKQDLPSAIDISVISEKLKYCVSISAGTGDGLKALESAATNILQIEEFDPYAGTLYTKRQEEDTVDAKDRISEALLALEMGMTLDAVTVCIEEALSALYRLTGEKVSEEVVDQVFEQFCVGK